MICLKNAIRRTQKGFTHFIFYNFILITLCHYLEIHRFSQNGPMSRTPYNLITLYMMLNTEFVLPVCYTIWFFMTQICISILSLLVCLGLSFLSLAFLLSFHNNWHTKLKGGNVYFGSGFQSRIIWLQGVMQGNGGDRNLLNSWWLGSGGWGAVEQNASSQVMPWLTQL